VLDGDQRRRHAQRWPWRATAIVVCSGMATMGVLVVVVKHRQAQLPRSGDCPSATAVNGAIGTRVAPASAVSENDLLGCFYAQGTDSQAVSVSFAIPAPLAFDPCRKRRLIMVSGDRACDVTGSRGTSRTGRSLLVEADLQYQFSSDLGQVTLEQLERLAVETLAMPAPPVENNGAR